MTTMIVSLGVVLSLSLLSAAVDIDYYRSSPFFDQECGRTCSIVEGTCEDRDQQTNLLCRCDRDCEMFGDCCENASTCFAAETNASRTTTAQNGQLRDLLECQSIFLDPRTKPNWMESFWMVSACPADWLAGRNDQVLLDTLNNCERGSENLPPVTDLESGLVYKNEYCAVCHEVDNFQLWAYQFECSPALRDAVGLPYFQLTAEVIQDACLPCAFSTPQVTAPILPPPRACLHDSLLDTRCLGREELQNTTTVPIGEEEYRNLVSLCRSGPVAPVVPGFPEPIEVPFGNFLQRLYNEFPFRNQYCALCSGIRVQSAEPVIHVSCVDPYLVRNSTNYCMEAATNLTFVIPPPPPTPTPPPATPQRPDDNSTFDFDFRPSPEPFVVPKVRAGPGPPPAPFTVVLDINGNTRDESVQIMSVNVTITCSDGQVYDWISQRCRNTLCPESARGEICAIVHNITLIGNSNISISCDGELIHLNSSEFDLIDNETLRYENEVFTIEGYLNGLPVICTDFTQNGTRQENRTFISYSYPVGFSIVTYIGCCLSVIGCSVVLFTYSIFKELRTLPGKILMNLTAAILATCLFLLIGIPLFALVEKDELCHTTAIFTHWLILSQFSWMTIMSYELARTLIRATHLRQTQTKTVQRNMFLLYLLIGWGVPTVFTGLCTVVNYTTDYIQYGEGGFCWIGHTTSFVIVMLVPVALMIILNAIAFAVTTTLLCKAQRSQAKLQKQNNTSYVRIYISVFSVTGLTWTFGFVAILAEVDWAWYLFVIFTTTQGFTICVAFLFTQKVASFYANYFWPKISSTFSLKSWTKPMTQDTSMAIHYTRKTENVSTVSNGFSSVEPCPPGKEQETSPVAEQDTTAEAQDEDVRRYENIEHGTVTEQDTTAEAQNEDTRRYENIEHGTA